MGGIYHHVCEDVEQKVRSMRGCVCVWVCGIYHHVCEDVEQKVRSMKCRREVFNVLVSSITELSIWKYTVTLSSTRPK